MHDVTIRGLGEEDPGSGGSEVIAEAESQKKRLEQTGTKEIAAVQEFQECCGRPSFSALPLREDYASQANPQPIQERRLSHDEQVEVVNRWCRRAFDQFPEQASFRGPSD